MKDKNIFKQIGVLMLVIVVCAGLLIGVKALVGTNQTGLQGIDLYEKIYTFEGATYEKLKDFEEVSKTNEEIVGGNLRIVNLRATEKILVSDGVKIIRVFAKSGAYVEIDIYLAVNEISEIKGAYLNKKGESTWLDGIGIDKDGKIVLSTIGNASHPSTNNAFAQLIKFAKGV